MGASTLPPRDLPHSWGPIGETYLAHRLLTEQCREDVGDRSRAIPRTGHQLSGAALDQQETETERYKQELFIARQAGDPASISAGRDLIYVRTTRVYMHNTRHKSGDRL